MSQLLLLSPQQPRQCNVPALSSCSGVQLSNWLKLWESSSGFSVKPARISSGRLRPIRLFDPVRCFFPFLSWLSTDRSKAPWKEERFLAAMDRACAAAKRTTPGSWKNASIQSLFPLILSGSRRRWVWGKGKGTEQLRPELFKSRGISSNICQLDPKRKWWSRPACQSMLYSKYLHSNRNGLVQLSPDLA